MKKLLFRYLRTRLSKNTKKIVQKGRFGTAYLRTYLVNRSHRVSNGLLDLQNWGLQRDERGTIQVGGNDVCELIKQYGSPLLVVNRQQLLNDAMAIRQAIGVLDKGSRITYSYKTNCIPGILEELHELGLGAEVISPYELWLAEKMGVTPDNIIYNGVNKTEESLERAIKLNILSINIDSISEIERIVGVAKRMKKKARVGVRLAFSKKTQFGLDIDSGEAMQACRLIGKHSDWLDMDMIHFSVTSNAKDSTTHCHYLKKSLEFSHALREQTNMTVGFVDIGGGIGVPTSKNMSGGEYGIYRLLGSLPKPPDPDAFENIETFITNIATTLASTCSRLNLEKPAVVIEPGRFVTSRGEFLLSTVLAVKKKTDGSRYVITDAGRLSMTFPCDFEYHAIFPAKERNGRHVLPQNIMG